MPGSDPELSPAFYRTVVRAIGPQARVLVKREAAAGGGFGAVVERLASHVPDEADRHAFLGAASHLS